MERKRCKRPLAAALTTLALFLGTALSAAPARAESGTVYTCAIHPCYAHPVTGVIEDSGGKPPTLPVRVWWTALSIPPVFWR